MFRRNADMDVRSIFERNAERLNALYAGIDQYPRYNALAEAFRAKFNGEPECFVSAPGRTEVVGNHTDHQNGRVLAGAIICAAVPTILFLFAQDHIIKGMSAGAVKG